jgi:hypothetical protein
MCRKAVIFGAGEAEERTRRRPRMHWRRCKTQFKILECDVTELAKPLLMREIAMRSYPEMDV